ncbi:TerD family protein [Actinocorallia longicatena]|uniref:TerD family protein n=1 Tax=Actinocorallia longicatena TaxID=111803 RepID=A0ABP6QIU5_9ACTN
MEQLVKGANVALAALSDIEGPVTLTLGWSDPTGAGEADVSVLLQGADGKARGDGDFFFYNHPSSADGTVQLLGKTPTGGGSEDGIQVDLEALPADVTGVVIAASRYGGATFGELDDLRLTLADSAGNPLLSFDIGDAGEETAFVFGELYRRDGAWKFRAVGQGYASGLAGLAGDFGIDVQDDEAEAEAGAEAVTEASTVAAEAADGGTVTRTAPEAVHAEPVRAEPAADVAAPPVAKTLEAPAAGRVRTGRRVVKKNTLPVAKVNLADHAGWQGARLFSVSGLRNDQEREVRATSTLLAVMTQVPEFGRRITARFGAPAGTMQTFAEASFKHGESTVRPDGVVRVSRAGRIWTALVETKTGGSPLKREQVESYLEVASRNSYECVITLSNDLALDGGHPVTVDRRKTRKVALRHLSWAEVAHEARLLCHHEGTANPSHAWLLGELLHYLEQDNAGCQGFQNMGATWVPIRNSITEGTLRPGDRRAVQVAENWEKLIRQLCLRLGGESGLPVAPVVRKKRGDDPAERRARTVAGLVETGRLTAEIKTSGAAGPLGVEADLRTGQIEATTVVPAPDRARTLTRVTRLLRQLDGAPGELRIEALPPGGSTGPCELLKNLRAEPGLLAQGGAEEIAAFRLTLPMSMGTRRGVEETGFIRSVDAVVDRFQEQVLAGLRVAEATP